MAAFDYRNAETVQAVLLRHNVRYLFFGKSGAILLGYSDTTQDVDLFVDKEAANCERLVAALSELDFPLTEQQALDIKRGKDFVQLRTGPFDLDLLFAPDGIEHFADAWQRRVERDGFPVAHIDDIIQSKEAANRQKDQESLPRLRKFRDWLSKQRP